MEERGRRTLAWCCGGFCAAVFLAVFALGHALMLLAAGASLAAGLLLYKRGTYRSRSAALALLCAVPGFLYTAHTTRTTLSAAEGLDGTICTIHARVLEEPVRYFSWAQCRVRLLTPGLPRLRCQLNDYSAALPELHPGDEIDCEVKLASAFVRYGEETDQLSSAGVFLRGSVRGQVKKSGAGGWTWLYAPRRWRTQMIRLCALVFPEDVEPFQRALLTGDKSALYGDYPLYYSLSRAGVMHVAAVSGMHLAFLVGFLGIFLPNKRRFGFLMLPMLGAFAAFAGFTPSVCRAAFMQSMMLLAPLFHRESDAPTSLLLILAVLLLCNPYAAASVSLQLSFGATAGILLFSERFYAALSERLPENRLGRAAASSLAVSCAALTLTLPLSALHFGFISLVAPLSNALCMGLISLLYVGGYGALALGAWLPGAGRALGWCLGWGDRLVFAIARLLTRLPCAAVYTGNPIYLWWMGAAYLLFALAALRARKRETSLRLTVPLCLTVLGLFGCVLAVRSGRAVPQVTAIDVGQGSCTLIECGDEAVMVDCGGTNTRDYAGERAAYTALGRGRNRLSALVLTHLHRDHINGVARLLALLDVEALYLPETEAEEELEELLAAAARSGTRVVTVREELKLEGEALKLRLTPPLEPERGGESCLFVLCSHGEWDVLITGDGEKSQERRYVQRRELPEIEVLIVGHHGAANSCSDYLLDAVQPEQALISVGYNTYGHPAEETLERLEARRIRVHRTDVEGSITVKGEA